MRLFLKNSIKFNLRSLCTLTELQGLPPSSSALGIGLAGRIGHFAGVGRRRQHRRSRCDHWAECYDTCGHVADDPISYLESEPYVDGTLIPLVGFSYFFCRQPFGRGRCPLGIDGGCFNRGCHRMVPDVAA